MYQFSGQAAGPHAVDIKVLRFAAALGNIDAVQVAVWMRKARHAIQHMLVPGIVR
jgi:hypothetical protein